MYAVFYEERAAKELAKINRPYQMLIRRKIERLAANFDALSGNLKRLKGEHEYYRLRVGSYRVIFLAEEKKLVITIVRIGHRKDIYQFLG